MCWRGEWCARRRKTDPIDLVSKDFPTLLLVPGTSDAVVQRKQSLRAANDPFRGWGYHKFVRGGVNSLPAFFLLVFALSLPLWIIGAVIRSQLRPGLPVSGALMAFCPAAAALLLVCRLTARRRGSPGGVWLPWRCEFCTPGFTTTAVKASSAKRCFTLFQTSLGSSSRTPAPTTIPASRAPSSPSWPSSWQFSRDRERRLDLANPCYLSSGRLARWPRRAGSTINEKS